MKNLVRMKSFMNIFQFMLELRMYVRFLGDCNLLKEIASNSQVTQKIESYEAEIVNFCRITSIASFVSCWQDRESGKIRHNFIEMQELDPNECALNDLEEYRKKLGRQLGQQLTPRLIECAIMFLKVELGSVCVTWLIPTEIVPEMRVVIRKH